MYQRILVPTDFSDDSARAVQHALALAHAVDAEVLLLHAFDRPVPTGLPMGNRALSSYLNEAARSARERLDEEIEALNDDRVRALFVEGRPWREIVESAHREGCDLICIAARGRSAIADVLVGSNTERVLHRSPVPVLVIKPPHPEEDAELEDDPEGDEEGDD